MAPQGGVPAAATTGAQPVVHTGQPSATPVAPAPAELQPTNLELKNALTSLANSVQTEIGNQNSQALIRSNSIDNLTESVSSIKFRVEREADLLQTVPSVFDKIGRAHV